MPAQRPRRELPRPLFALARPAFRYSATRGAYVLRLVGARHGPVIRPRRLNRS